MNDPRRRPGRPPTGRARSAAERMRRYRAASGGGAAHGDALAARKVRGDLARPLEGTASSKRAASRCTV